MPGKKIIARGKPADQEGSQLTATGRFQQLFLSVTKTTVVLEGSLDLQVTFQTERRR
jgi:hypothetical protein